MNLKMEMIDGNWVKYMEKLEDVGVGMHFSPKWEMEDSYA